MNADNLQKKVTIKDFLKSNIKIFSTIFFILILISLFFLWNDYTNKIKKKKVSQNFVEGKVLLSKNNNEDSLKILKEVITAKDETYSPLALYLIIDKNLEKDPNIINEYFDLVISISKLKTEDLNLLKLKKAIHNPIINSKSIWRIQSVEFLGDYYFSKKQFKKAEQYYSILLNQENSDIDVSDLKRKMKTIKK